MTSSPPCPSSRAPSSRQEDVTHLAAQLALLPREELELGLENMRASGASLRLMDGVESLTEMMLLVHFILPGRSEVSLDSLTWQLPLLAQEGVPLDKPTGDLDQCPMHTAAALPGPQGVSTLLALGAPCDPVDKLGRTPLFFASAVNIPLLTLAGCSLEHRDDNGLTALGHTLQYQERLASAWALLEAGSQIDPGMEERCLTSAGVELLRRWRHHVALQETSSPLEAPRPRL